MNFPDITQLEETIKLNFPNLVLPTKTAMSVITTLLLNDISDPTGLIFQGSPSSEKTTTLRFFDNNPNLTFWTDSFSPKSFVSHSANVPENKLEKIDLLPKIKNKCLIVPELATIFGKRKDDLVECLSILTRLFDGEGLETDSGVRGHRGYKGEYLFSFLGATTPLPDYVWRTTGKLGNRWFFYNIPEIDCTTEELADNLIQDENYMDRVRECREKINKFLNDIFLFYGGIKSVFWNKRADDKKLIKLIVELGKLVAVLRGSVEISEVKAEEGEVAYTYNIPIKEDPKRAINILYNIARGHAIINGRLQLSVEDIEPIVHIVLSSAPYERVKLFTLALKNGRLDYLDIKQHLGCSRRHAYRIMETLSVLGLGDICEGDVEDELDSKRKHFIIDKNFIKLFKDLEENGITPSI